MTVTATFATRKKPARQSARPDKKDAGAEDPRPSLLNVGPVWITAIAGLITAVAGALVLFGLGNTGPEPEVAIDQATATETNLTANGTYAGLLGDEQTVVLLFRATDSDGRWTAVEVNRQSAAGGAEGAEEGEWTIDLPLGGGSYEVHAVVVPARQGGSFETIEHELADAGPDADVVRARSDSVVAEGG